MPRLKSSCVFFLMNVHENKIQLPQVRSASFSVVAVRGTCRSIRNPQCFCNFCIKEKENKAVNSVTMKENCTKVLITLGKVDKELPYYIYFIQFVYPPCTIAWFVSVWLPDIAKHWHKCKLIIFRFNARLRVFFYFNTILDQCYKWQLYINNCWQQPSNKS